MALNEGFPDLVNGRLPVDGSGVTQPISGTVTITPSGTQNVNVTNASGASAVNIQDGGNSITVDGTITANAGSGTFTVDGSGVTQPISASSLPLPTGASTSALQTTGNSSLSSIDSKTPSLGQALSSASVPVVLPAAQITTLTPPTTVTVTQGTGSNLHTVIDSGTITTITNVVHIDDNSGSITIDGTVAATQSGTWNINNVSGTVSLPTGAATAAKQPALGTSGTASTDVITVQGISGMTAIKTDGSATTQPISGTITANIGTTNGLALDATLTGGTQKTKLVDSGGTNVATVSAAGAVKVDGSAVTQPISGTVAATQSGTWTVQPGNTANTTAWKVDGSAVTQPVSGTVTANAGTNLNTSALNLETTQSAINTKIPSGLTVTSTRLLTDGSGVTQPISASSLPLPTGAATSANQTTTNTSLSSIDGKLPALITTTPSLSASAITVRPIPYEPTSYSAVASAFTPAATATDVFTLTGSGTKTINVHRIEVSGTTTSGSAIKITLGLIRRSAANTGGTTSAITVAKHDSTNAAATASAVFYTANAASLGASAGTIRSNTTSFQASGVSDTNLNWDFNDDGGQPIVLRGTSEVLAINFNSTTVTGGVISISVEWSEV